MHRKLIDLCTIQYGYAFNASLFTEDESFPPIIRIRDVKRGYSETYYSGNYSGNYIIRKGDILIGMDGEFNIAKWQSQDALLNQRVCKVNPNANVNGDYLLYALSRKLKSIEENTAFVTVKHLSAKELNKIVIQAPDYSQQTRVANTINSLLYVIAKYQSLLAKLDELVKARFVEMFGDPVSNPLQWPTNKLQKVAPHKPVAFQESKSIWLLNLDMIESNTGRIIDYKYTSSDNIGSSTCCFDASHVLYSKLRPYLNKVVLPRQFGVATSELLALRPNSSLNRIFLANLLRGDFFVRFISEKVSGAKMPRVAMDIFWAFPCIIPPMELQRRFADFVQQVDKSKVVVQLSQKRIDVLHLLW